MKNISRERWYGVRVGDRVTNGFRTGYVVELDGMNQNNVFVVWDGDFMGVKSTTPEHLTILEKAEEMSMSACLHLYQLVNQWMKVSKENV